MRRGSPPELRLVGGSTGPIVWVINLPEDYALGRYYDVQRLDRDVTEGLIHWNEGILIRIQVGQYMPCLGWPLPFHSKHTVEVCAANVLTAQAWRRFLSCGGDPDGEWAA